MSLIMLGTSFLIIAILYWQASTASKVNKNIILGVMIPPLELENKEVINIAREFIKTMRTWFVGSLIVFTPSMLFKTTWLLVLWFIWLGAIYFVYYKIICKYNNKLKEVKRNNNWLLPNKHIVNIDTELTRAKSKMPIAKWWFILAIIISIVPFILDMLIESKISSTAIICSGTSLIGTSILFIVYLTYVKGRAVVYCDESEINIACNKIYKRTWSIVYVVLSIVQSIINTIIYLFMLLPKANENLFLIVVIMPVLLIVIGVMYGNKKIIETQNKLISTAKNPIYVDSDDYWINGMSYKNPYDTRVVVEPRIGTKSVYNLATKKGKLIEYGSNIFAIVIVATIMLMFIAFELSGFRMIIDNEIIKVNSPMYGSEFKISEIEEVKLVDDIKVKIRTNGIGMDEYSVGNFIVEDYGKCKLYIYNNSEPYILIKEKDGIIFINGESKEETMSYYADLKKVTEENK